MHQIQNLKGVTGRPPPLLGAGLKPVGPWALGLRGFRGNFVKVCSEINGKFAEHQSCRAIDEVASAFQTLGQYTGAKL